MERKRKSFRDSFESFFDSCARVGGFASGIAIFLLMLLTTYAVIMRYIVHKPQAWTFDMTIFLQIGFIFLGLAYTLLEEGHIRVDVLLVLLPEKVRLVLNTITTTVIFIFSAILTWYSTKQALTNWGRLTDSAAQLPLFPSYAVIPVGSFLLCMVCFGQIGRSVVSLMRDEGGD